MPRKAPETGAMIETPPNLLSSPNYEACNVRAEKKERKRTSSSHRHRRTIGKDDCPTSRVNHDFEGSSQSIAMVDTSQSSNQSGNGMSPSDSFSPLSNPFPQKRSLKGKREMQLAEHFRWNTVNDYSSTRTLQTSNKSTSGLPDDDASGGQVSSLVSSSKLKREKRSSKSSRSQRRVTDNGLNQSEIAEMCRRLEEIDFSEFLAIASRNETAPMARSTTPSERSPRWRETEDALNAVLNASCALDRGTEILSNQDVSKDRTRSKRSKSEHVRRRTRSKSRSTRDRDAKEKPGENDGGPSEEGQKRKSSNKKRSKSSKRRSSDKTLKTVLQVDGVSQSPPIETRSRSRRYSDADLRWMRENV